MGISIDHTGLANAIEFPSPPLRGQLAGIIGESALAGRPVPALVGLFADDQDGATA